MDSALVAALVAGGVSLASGTLTAWITLRTARDRARVDQALQNRLKIAEARLPAYAALWKCMEKLSPTGSAPLPAHARSELDEALRKAFYEQGAGLMLSHSAFALYLGAVDRLNDPKASDESIRAGFSALRTQMKTDLNVYTQDEAARPVRGASEAQARSASVDRPLDSDLPAAG